MLLLKASGSGSGQTEHFGVNICDHFAPKTGVQLRALNDGHDQHNIHTPKNNVFLSDYPATVNTFFASLFIPLLGKPCACFAAIAEKPVTSTIAVLMPVIPVNNCPHPRYSAHQIQKMLDPDEHHLFFWLELELELSRCPN
ncbi:hypothetical protein [Pedobacter sp. Bi27]|uniref:hypothetical protein n=1 Tax=Pedobacter sp. Bi27 TaxID=2822351 RepID=UPI001E620C26|nr:hypothetical protein [Pedobacter sp. Bi27]